jgi:hypothetical protein
VHQYADFGQPSTRGAGSSEAALMAAIPTGRRDRYAVAASRGAARTFSHLFTQPSRIPMLDHGSDWHDYCASPAYLAA